MQSLSILFWTCSNISARARLRYWISTSRSDLDGMSLSNKISVCLPYVQIILFKIQARILSKLLTWCPFCKLPFCANFVMPFSVMPLCVLPFCVMPFCVLPLCVLPFCVMPLCVMPFRVFLLCVMSLFVMPFRVLPLCVMPPCVMPFSAWYICDSSFFSISFFYRGLFFTNLIWLGTFQILLNPFHF